MEIIYLAENEDQVLNLDKSIQERKQNPFVSEWYNYMPLFAIMHIDISLKNDFSKHSL